MAGFAIVWIGQIISLLGTAMSNFGLTLWAYQATGKATPLAMIGFFFIAPMVALGPFIGVLVDRGNRKVMMMLSDLGAALASAVVLVLLTTGNLQIWHLYITAAISGTLQGFQWPAYSAAITLMLPKEQYTRANGMMEMAGNASTVFAPLMAGALIGPLGLAGLLIIDLACAAFAISTLLVIHVPQPTQTEAGREAAGHFLKEAAYGFRYIFARPSLLGLQTVFLVGNFFSGLAYAVIAPMILGRTGNNELIFGSVQSAGAIGGVIGAVGMSAWGGFKRRVHGVLLGWFCGSLLGQAVLGLGRGLPLWAASSFVWGFFSPLINASNQAIWQSKVAPDVQGRVFTARQFIAWLVLPVTQLLAGPLADRVLEPAMAEGSRLAPLFGWIVGTGTGAGIALLFVFTGLFAALTGLSGYLFPAVRDAETLLPDHDQAAATG
jgi:DHA3 family macrolide efflux protein-like MFS transporter